MVRVRFAPSPTGIPHIGGTRTALFTFLFARKNKGEFILRIEDTDRKRLVEGSEEAIEEILKWLGLAYDKKYKQSERLEVYKKYAEELVGKKIAYEKEGATYVHVPEDKEFSWVDAVGNKEISFKGSDVEDFVILKSDGFPTYHLASVVDDHSMEISHVMRGEEWTSSTPKHLYLYESFGWDIPTFVHLPVILGPDHAKLSKRHGAKSALDFRDEGYLPEAINNYTALLGWNPGGEEEVMDLAEMILRFDLKDINTSNPVFDLRKLEWMNGVWIRKLDPKDLKSRILDSNPGIKDSAELEQFVKLAQTRITKLTDFATLIEPFLSSSQLKLNNAQLSIVKDLREKFSKISNWNQDKIFEALKEVLVKHNIKMPVLYKIFIGQDSGLPLPASLEILGKEKTLLKLDF
jgi:glutamyl-tRNA synthetase